MVECSFTNCKSLWIGIPLTMRGGVTYELTRLVDSVSVCDVVAVDEGESVRQDRRLF